MVQLCKGAVVPKDVSDDDQAAEQKSSCLNQSVQSSLYDTGAGGCSFLHCVEVILFIVLSVFWEDLKQWQLQEPLQAGLPHPWRCQGQVWWSSELPGVVEGSLAYLYGKRWALMSLAAQAMVILCLSGPCKIPCVLTAPYFLELHTNSWSPVGVQAAITGLCRSVSE